MKKANIVNHMERALGFETIFLLPEGLLSEKVQTIQTKNTRKTDEVIEQRIVDYWQKNRQHYMFDGDRARFEGIHYKQESHELKILFSHERYRTYFYTGNTTLPRSYQAQLLSINGIVITKDNLIPIGLRRGETNQGRIWHIVPAGYIDVRPVVCKTTKVGAERPSQGWCSETPYAATERELHEELAVPKESLITDKMKLIGIVFNYRKNYDATISVIVPAECDSSEMTLRGEEHEIMRFLKASLGDLKEELIKLSRDQNTSSGHLRGDIALTIAHLYGFSEYARALEVVSRQISETS